MAESALRRASGLGIEGVFPDQASDLREIARFEGFGDLGDEFRRVCGGHADAEIGEHGGGIFRHGGFRKTLDFRRRLRNGRGGGFGREPGLFSPAD